MPTPSTDPLPEPPSVASPSHRSLHATCPPEDACPSHLSRAIAAAERSSDTSPSTSEDAASPTQHTPERSGRGDSFRPTASRHSSSSSIDSTTSSQDLEAASELMHAPLSPRSSLEESKIDGLQADGLSSGASGYSFSSLKRLHIPFLRPLPKYTPSFLRPGSKFTGTQQSDRQVYNVQVEIKHVDMAESLICGYLRIEGLTADHPTLTTYFEGEIIGNKYTFQTRHDEWGSNEKVDMQHWNRFPAWRPLARAARRTDFTYKNYADREHIFMRWKEYFLVPDHRVRTISGASFEGFYYICFNQLSGTVSGIYFHAKSEKYQQLELRHVDDRGCMGGVEFR